jgi:hypothetical protein
MRLGDEVIRFLTIKLSDKPAIAEAEVPNPIAPPIIAPVPAEV